MGTMTRGDEQEGRGTTVQDPPTAAEPARHWTFLSNHGHVLVCLARDPEARLRDVAVAVGITERAVQKIVSDLEEAGVVERLRDGRRNRYRLFLDRPLRHPIEAHRTIGALLGMLLNPLVLKRLSGPPSAE
jgi:DNA-binding transcriptional ArsR family regulator